MAILKALGLASRVTDRAAQKAWLSVVSLVAIILVWGLLSGIGVIKPSFAPSPGGFVKAFVLFWAHGYEGTSPWREVGISLMQVVVGLGAGIVVGVPTGLAMGYNRGVEAMLVPVFSFLRPIPPLAFIPLAILYLGIGQFAKIVVIFGAALLYVTLSSYMGARSVPKEYVYLSRNLQLSGPRVLLTVLVPAAMPSILSGIRTATAICWATVVAAELIGAQSGLGYMIENASTFNQVSVVFVALFLLGVIGFGLDWGVASLQRRFVHWEGRH